MNPSPKVIEIIKEFEGYKSKAYQDIVGVWTIGYGTTRIGDRKVECTDNCNEDQAEQYLLDAMQDTVTSINKLIKVPVTQNQFDALVDFCYNLGVRALANSTLLAKLNTKDYNGAAAEFIKWNHAGGKEVPGLTRRRLAERALFLS